jgi:hypothetical protein
MSGKRNMIDITKAKMLAVCDGRHRQIKNDYMELQNYTRTGWLVYAIIEEGIFFFLDNRDEDGADWNKISSDV